MESPDIAWRCARSLQLLRVAGNRCGDQSQRSLEMEVVDSFLGHYRLALHEFCSFEIWRGWAGRAEVSGLTS